MLLAKWRKLYYRLREKLRTNARTRRFMSELPLLIISPDADFSLAMAAHVKRELAIACVIVSGNKEAKQHLASVFAVITTEIPDDAMTCPVITVAQPPVKLQDLLDDIAHILHNQLAEEVSLGGRYSLQLRHKQLNHLASGQSVLLTDKEVALLQNLARGKGQVASKEQLLKDVWGFDETIDTHTLETHIYRLRGKFRELSDDDEIIAATDGGYKLEL